MSGQALSLALLFLLHALHGNINNFLPVLYNKYHQQCRFSPPVSLSRIGKIKLTPIRQLSWKLRGKIRAVDPHSFFADPDPALFMNADPDPGGKMNADPDPAFQIL